MRYKKKKNRSIIVVYLLAGLILLGFFLLKGQLAKKPPSHESVRGDHTLRYANDNLLEYKGKQYRENTNLTTILLIGVDTEGSVTSSPYRSGGQADFLRLIILDPTERTVAQLKIDRDTMTPITILGVLGNVSGTRTAQLCLSYGYGDGQQKSCDLTQNAVSNLLGGITIDAYFSMNMDGISKLNDMLGGITVTLEDDFSSLDPTMTVGKTITLTGNQAELYVRSRKAVGIGTNEARMKRQEVYISKLTDNLSAKLEESEQFAGILYDELLPYLVTDMSRGRLINEVWAAKDYRQLDTLEIQGSHQVGADGFIQFHADQQALSQLILDVFYTELKS